MKYHLFIVLTFLFYSSCGEKKSPTQENKKNSQRIGNMENGMLQNFAMEPEILKSGKMDEVLKRGQNILVQILKDSLLLIFKKTKHNSYIYESSQF